MILHPVVADVLYADHNLAPRLPDHDDEVLVFLDELVHQQFARDTQTPDGPRIVSACLQVCALLLSKNASYGGSALTPLAVFSHATPQERLAVRLDDKIARIARGTDVAGEDAVLDLVGYLLLMIAKDLPDPEGT